MESGLVVVDEDRRGNVHGIYRIKAVYGLYSGLT